MNETVLANVQVTGPGTAVPVIRFSTSQVFLEPIESAIALLAVTPDFSIYAFFTAIQRLHGTRAVVNDPEGAGKPQLMRALGDRYCIFGILNTAADHRINVDGKFGVA